MDSGSEFTAPDAEPEKDLGRLGTAVRLPLRREIEQHRILGRVTHRRLRLCRSTAATAFALGPVIECVTGLVQFITGTAPWSIGHSRTPGRIRLCSWTTNGGSEPGVLP
ncbi:hypothetical protein CH296_06250 [Rhodococcus sp. 14-2496-1d]|nr:hypothetical protein CH296_06250 [Rhodococcus sp. 14-2496-1d]